VPIYHKHRLIHIHIPKTGGTAIEQFFHEIGDMTWGLESWVGQERRNGRWYEYQHLSLPELQSLSKSEYETYDSFAVVRNPYSRLLSDYIWRQAISQVYPESPTPAFASFDAFIRAIPKDINSNWTRHIHNADQKEANFLIHIRPQYKYIIDAAENLLVDDIFRFENLDQEIDKLFNRYCLKNTKFIKPHNRNLNEFFNRTTISIVNEIYEKDFQQFSYEML